MKEIKSLQIFLYHAVYTTTHMWIGCEDRELDVWWSYSKKDIEKIDKEAAEQWSVWKPILKKIIALSPAIPTKDTLENV